MKFGTPLARKMESFWKENANNPSSQAWKRYLDTYIALQLLKKEELLTEHVNVDEEGNRVYGLSRAAGCVRNSTLGLLDVKGEDFSGSSLFTFWIGHQIETSALATLDGIGYNLNATQKKIELPGLFASASDAEITYLGKPTIVSVKSTGYKMSGKRQGKYIRQGFAALPFEGIKASQSSWYVQGNTEAYLSGYDQWLCIVGAKDIVKAFENDEFLGNTGNGSLSFYTELLRTDEEIAKKTIEVHKRSYEQYLNGEAGEAYYWNSKEERYITLNKAEYIPSNIWGGKNQQLTGTFNPCGGCDRLKGCENYE